MNLLVNLRGTVSKRSLHALILPPLFFIAISLGGCSSFTLGSSPTATPTPSPTMPPTATPTATVTRVVPTAGPRPRPTSTVTISGPYAAFLHGLCTALEQRDAAAVVGMLPYYEYNSGLRYGFLGDGEGQTGDPSLMQEWLSTSRVQCVRYTPGVHGHGIALTEGWSLPHGSAGLIEMDLYGGKWKINDFTFGPPALLQSAMGVGLPIVTGKG